MELQGKHIGLAITGSFCTFARIEQEIIDLKETGAILHPIFSDHVQSIESRFGDTGAFIKRITEITGTDPVLTIEAAEPIGPGGYLDLLLIAPCTGNTLAKLAAGITDTPVLMAAKAHLRNAKPLVISVSTNDAMGMNFKNIGELYNTKHIFFVPFGQDDPVKKPTSLIAHTGRIRETLMEALNGRQVQPVIQSI